ncbi:MAG: UvrD-helicase domain-containing protein [Chloroherpetonaceae bacterium]|nr:UvrD-helicase domain-containing protein [Chthonomonadaceae bacterium]MDW8207260.1 UvrD-helicase domain-containing protein [Chloroherpetonaceae bacterium]
MSDTYPATCSDPEHAPEVEALLGTLNAVQRQAVLHGEGPLLVAAGAGSGKTRVLTHRIAYLIAGRGVAPGNILAVTFTNKAAKEMRERVGRLIGEDRVRQLWIGTFHAICLRILREFGSQIGLSRDFVIYDETDQRALMRECLQQLALDPQIYPPRDMLMRISQAKEQLLPLEAWDTCFQGFPEGTCEVYRLYQTRLRASNALDFDDLLAETVRLLGTDGGVRQRLQRRFQYLLVDEYQDVNYAQYVLLQQLAANHRNLCVVGDEDQSIYSFRGANVELFLRFPQDYPGARVIKLEQNYRSTTVILQAANAVIQHNQQRTQKRLWSQKQGGVPLVQHEAPNPLEEAYWIAQRIRDAVTRGSRTYRDFAVLFRTNAQSRVLEEMFINWRIPHVLVGSVRFYDRRVVRDVLAYLRVVQNPADGVSLKRIINVPPRGIGSATLRALEADAQANQCALWDALLHADRIPQLSARARARIQDFVQLISGLRGLRDQVSVTEITRYILEETGYWSMLRHERNLSARDELEHIQELLAITREFETQTEEPTLGAFLEQAALFSAADMSHHSGDAVVLMTLHAAKGLEFPVVFLTGMEEGLFPHARSQETQAELEEERRLCYVGITRAMEELCLTYAQRRPRYPEELEATPDLTLPSRFLSEIPADLFYPDDTPSRPAVSSFDPDAEEFPVASHSSRARPQSLPGDEMPRESRKWERGQKVRHAQFGEGTILDVRLDGRSRTMELAIAFEDKRIGVRRLCPEYAGLEQVPGDSGRRAAH